MSDDVRTTFPMVPVQAVGRRPDGQTFYAEMDVVPSALGDRLMFEYVLTRLARKLADVADGPCEPTMFISPWERWDIIDGAVAAVESSVIYGPAPWTTAE